MKIKVVIAVNAAWNLVNFRAGLIRALVAEGYEVIAVAPPDQFAAKLAELGCRYVPLHMDNTGTNPARDLQLLWKFYCLLRRERPAVFMGFTVKPNVYGSLAAHVMGIPVINNIAGLGVVFIRKSWLTSVVRFLYRLSLSRSRKVFFQNNEDQQLFVDGGMVHREVADRVPGSGVDLVRFCGTAMPPLANLSAENNTTKPIRFLLVSRMLWDKGVGEFVEAARQIRGRTTQNVEFALLGFLDVKNPAAISREQMQDWVNEGAVVYHGAADDVRPYLWAADCIVLPSYYREGVPRCLLEAAAMGRPIITTDAVGCRDAVEDGLTGFLCRPRDATDLVKKLEAMIELSHEDRAAMGLRGKEKMTRDFDEDIVVKRYLAATEAALR